MVHVHHLGGHSMPHHSCAMPGHIPAPMTLLLLMLLLGDSIQSHRLPRHQLDPRSLLPHPRHLKLRPHLLTPMEMDIADLQLANLHTRRLLLLNLNIKHTHIPHPQLLIMHMSNIHLIHMPILPSKLKQEHSSWLKPVDPVEPAVPFLTMADLWRLQHPVDLLLPTRRPQLISLPRHPMLLLHQHQPCRLHMRMG
jgi:hypothetical protein